MKHPFRKCYLTAFGIIVLAIAVFIGYRYRQPFTPKVAVLYIATGRYITFWEQFYASAEKYFLPDYKKQYFIFTDNNHIVFPNNVTKINRKNNGFPADSIDRFEMFTGIKSDLSDYDYVYFFNANALFVSPVDETVLPSIEQGLAVAIHPAYYNQKNPDKFPYERNPKSTAYIPPSGIGNVYVQGSFIGGRTSDFLTMSEKLSAHILQDKNNHIMAKWHDESHLNKYIIDKSPLILPPNYTWAPFDLTLFKTFQSDLKIIMRTKNTPKYGTTDFLRGKTDERLSPELTQIAPLALHLSEIEMQLAIPVYTADWIDYLIYKDDTIFCRSKQPQQCGKIEKGHNALTIYWETGEEMPLKYDFTKKVYVPKQ